MQWASVYVVELILGNNMYGNERLLPSMALTEISHTHGSYLPWRKLYSRSASIFHPSKVTLPHNLLKGKNRAKALVSQLDHYTESWTEGVLLRQIS